MKSLDDFNEETRKIIIDCTNDLFIMLPNLENKITKDQIINTFLQNISQNIEFNCGNLGKNVGGQYSNGKIRILKIDNENRIKSIVFHELMHALIKDIHKNEIIKKHPYAIEIFVSILQKKYNETIINYNSRNVNGYLYQFGEQLKTIYGDSLLEQLIVDPEHIENAFYDDERFSFLHLKQKFLNDFCKNVQILNNVIESGSGIDSIDFRCVLLENSISDQMCFISYTKDISYLKIVEELYSMQRTPTYGKFINAINGFKRKSQSFDNEILKYPKLNRLYMVSKIDDKEKLKNLFRLESFNKDGAALAKYFGFLDEDSEIYDFYCNKTIYNYFKKLICDNNMNYEDLKDLTYRKANLQLDKKSVPINPISEPIIYNIVNEELEPLSYIIYDNKKDIVKVLDSYGSELTKGFNFSFDDIVNKVENKKLLEIIKEIINILDSKKIDISQIYSSYHSLDSILDIEIPGYIDFIYVNGEVIHNIEFMIDEDYSLQFNDNIVQMEEEKELVQSNEFNFNIEGLKL